MVEEEPILKTMSKKLKIILGLLLLVAGFLVVRIGLYFKNSGSAVNSPSVMGIAQPGDNPNPLLDDSDGDGIADVEETYYRTDPFDSDSDDDGYLDGEEIISGFDPIGDDKERLAKENANVTENFTQRMIAGIYAGDLNPRNGKGEAYDNGVDQLALAVIDETSSTLQPNLNRSQLITSDDSKESQEEYLRRITSLIDGPFLNTFLSQIDTLRSAANMMLANKFGESSKIFGDLSMTYIGAYTQLQTVPVPPKWLSFHKNMLTTFQKIANDYKAMQTIEQDPLMALAGISDFASNISGIEFSLVQELRTLVQQENLELPESNLFDVLNLLKTAN